ncbi:hypothetical protein QAD02_010999 [Eretmocerus hayati]|uniref:Uncharacterized protein n=1 Tax=Eretmocerus hayati TaxID=131215 RepID=A0ACC2NWH9_9HYME|nr:hypothetical protein QAD02_010999 [Eretmocerus hayati]
MKLFGVEFAPLWIPLERRLQTLSAAMWILIGAFGPMVSWLIAISVLLFSANWLRLLMFGYLVFVYLDRDVRLRGGRGKWFTLPCRNSSWWHYYCGYFPIKLVKTVDLDPSRNYLFCAFPHGLLASGVTGAFATNGADCAKIFPGLDFRVLTLDQHFLTPFLREYILSHGACSCDEQSINYLLSTKPTEKDGPTKDPVQGRAVVIIVGGAAEAFKCKPRTYKILLKRRKGFIRLALKNGSPLVPVFSFGETDLYDQVDNPEGSKLRAVQEFIKKHTGIAPVVPIGRGFFQYTFGLIPQRSPIHVVVGSPMEVPRIPNPTKEQIEKYHAKFTEKLTELFEEHKSKYLEDHEKITLMLED